VIIIPIILMAHTFLNETGWLIIWWIAILVIGVEAIKYNRCLKKHEKLIELHGDRYISILEKEIKKNGINNLVQRDWTDLEPK